jgi:hypothetical protein
MNDGYSYRDPQWDGKSQWKSTLALLVFVWAPAALGYVQIARWVWARMH